MRKQLPKAMKQYIRQEMLKVRETLHMSQEEMARKLQITTREYTNIEGGKYGCDITVLLLFLVQYCTDLPSFLEGMRSEMEAEKQEKKE